MTKLSEIYDNLTNTPPRLLKTLDELLQWCEPGLRAFWNHTYAGIFLDEGQGVDGPAQLKARLVENGLYPYRPEMRPARVDLGTINRCGPYRELGIVVDDYLVTLLAGDVYHDILRLIEREGATFLAARGEDESVRDFLLRMRAWCLRVRPDHSERPLPLSKAATLIYEKLLSLKPHEAMLTRQIQDWYEVKAKANLDEGTWKKLRKEMEPYGLKNRRRAGYYIDQKMTL